ncbi:MAG: glycosyltransferase family 39 protein [Holophagales bacterium]|nr:glycosyltransferase family 39 protein [Holophagales bacterium]
MSDLVSQGGRMTAGNQNADGRSCALAFLALCSAAALALGSRMGLGLSPDSVSYVEQARAMLSGQPYSSLHFPPLYSTALAAGGVLGLDLLEAARWLNVLCLGASLYILGRLLSEVCRDRMWLPLIGSLWFFNATVDIYLMAWSEPPFLTLQWVGTYALWKYFHRDEIRWLTLAAGAFGLASLCRYIGVALIAGATLALLLKGRRNLRTRVRSALAFAVVAVLPASLWALRNILLFGSPSDRTLVFHPVLAQKLGGVRIAAMDWASPIARSLSEDHRRSLGVLAVAITAFVLGFAVARARSPMSRAPERITTLWTLCGCLIVSYLGLLSLSITFYDAHTPLNPRILSPIVGPVLLLFSSLVDRIPRRSFGRKAILVLLLFNQLAGLGTSAGAVRRGFEDGGVGFASRKWRESATIEWLRRLESDAKIYSNGHDAISILTERQSIRLPLEEIPRDRRSNPTFEAEIERMWACLESGSCLLAYFPRVRRTYMPTEKWLREQLAIEPVAVLDDGTVYRASGSPTATDGEP